MGERMQIGPNSLSTAPTGAEWFNMTSLTRAMVPADPLEDPRITSRIRIGLVAAAVLAALLVTAIWPDTALGFVWSGPAIVLTHLLLSKRWAVALNVAVVLAVVALVAGSLGGGAIVISLVGLVGVSALVWFVNDVATLRQEQLRHMLITDPLTGLHNRIMLSSTLDAALSDFESTATASTLITFDVDRFDGLNENYGHDYAKQVLVAIAETLRANLRDSDGVFRTGDKEFAVLLPEVSGAGSITVAERLRNAVAEAPLVESGRVTVSAGIVQMEAGDTAQMWIDRADRFLHQAKRQSTRPHAPFVLTDEPVPQPQAQHFSGQERRQNPAPDESRNLARLSERLQSPERRRAVLTQVQREIEDVELQLFRFELEEPAG